MTSPAKIPFTALLGWVLQAQRKEAGLSQAAVARHVGIQQSAWAKIEKGVYPINVIQLVHFSELVGVDLSVLFARVERAQERVHSMGNQVFLDRAPSTNRDAAGSLLIGAALGALLSGLLLSGND